MGFNRGNFLSALAGLIAGVLLVSVLPAAAADDDPLILGQKNTGKTVTRVNTRGGLRIDNFRTGNPALILNVEDPSSAPMQVNADGQVDNLNAEYVGGYTAAHLIPDWEWVSNDDLPNDSEWSESLDVTVPPEGGAIVMSGSLMFYNSKTTPVWFSCSFDVGGTQLAASVMAATAGAGEYGTCSSTAMISKPGGTYSVQFVTNGMADVTIDPYYGYWWAHSLSQ